MRLLLVKLVGPGGKLHGPGGRWTHAELADAAADFFRGRRAIAVNADLRTWCCVILHRVHLGIELSEDEAEGFMAMQMKVLAISGFPAVPLRVGALRKALDIDKIKAEKASWLERQGRAARGAPGRDGAAERRRVLVVCVGGDGQLALRGRAAVGADGDGVLPRAAVLAEGGTRTCPRASRSTTPRRSRATSSRRFGASPSACSRSSSGPPAASPTGASSSTSTWRSATRKCGARTRRPSSGSPWPPSTTSTRSLPPTRRSPHLASANSHACPGKELAFGLVLALLKEFAHTASGVASAGGTKALWKCDKAPEEIKITAFSLASSRSRATPASSRRRPRRAAATRSSRC